jgi:hypothetical protein
MGYFEPLLGPLIQVVRRLGGGSRFPLEELAADFQKALRRDPEGFANLSDAFSIDPRADLQPFLRARIRIPGIRDSSPTRRFGRNFQLGRMP